MRANRLTRYLAGPKPPRRRFQDTVLSYMRCNDYVCHRNGSAPSEGSLVEEAELENLRRHIQRERARVRNQPRVDFHDRSYFDYDSYGQDFGYGSDLSDYM